MAFIDEVEIEVASGGGGPGCVSFRRESHVPRGGPDGGDGGRGGHVIFRVSKDLNTLINFKHRRRYKAKNGAPGAPRNCSGPDGEDLIFEVPAGTIIKNSNGEVIKDLSLGDEFLFLEGGLGGKGNTFYKTSVHQTPQIAQRGIAGIETKIKLELKLIADVGIIGFPNVGKSTLISHISAARPKVANYPFTTLEPNLGVVKLSEAQSYVIADIPGIIEGAHQGVGLGLQFLKHIERTAAFLHIIDVCEDSGRDPVKDYEDILKELKKYDEQNAGSPFAPLIERPQLVVLNKIDSVTEQRLYQIESGFQKKKIEYMKISAVTGQNLKDLKYNAFELMLKGREAMNE